MIRANFFEDAEHLLTGFRISGHAGLARAGEDIVCAAVSILVHVAVVSLDFHLPEPPAVNRRGDQVTCEIPKDLNAADRERAGIILRSVYLGLKDIEEQYAHYIQLAIRGCTI